MALFFGALALALVFGLARGLVTSGHGRTIWRACRQVCTEADETVSRRGGPIVAALWLLTLVCRGAVAWIAYKSGVPETAALIWLEFAVTLLAQNGTIMARASHVV